MRGYVGNTDFDWFTYLRTIEPPIDEVNFWKPGSGTGWLRCAGSRRTILLQAESTVQRHRRVRVLRALLEAAGVDGLAGLRQRQRRLVVWRDARSAGAHPHALRPRHRSAAGFLDRLHPRQSAGLLRGT